MESIVKRRNRKLACVSWATMLEKLVVSLWSTSSHLCLHTLQRDCRGSSIKCSWGERDRKQSQDLGWRWAASLSGTSVLIPRDGQAWGDSGYLGSCLLSHRVGVGGSAAMGGGLHIHVCQVQTLTNKITSR